MKKITILLLSILAIQLFAGTAWINTGKAKKYPRELYFVGVGLSDRGAANAKQNALIEVKKQISVDVKSTVLDEMKSISINGIEAYSEKTISKSNLSVSGNIKGIELVATHKKGKIIYALAVLEKDKFASAIKAEIKELKKNVAKLKTNAEADIKSGNIGIALKSLMKAKRLIREIREQRAMLTAAVALTKAQALDITENDLSIIIEKCITSIKVEKSGGDKQEVVVGGALENPFILYVGAGETPIANLRVRLLDEDDKKVMEVYTNSDGLAEFYLGEKGETSVGRHEYTTRLIMPASSSLKRYLKSQDKTFKYKVISNPSYAKIEVVFPSSVKYRNKSSIEKKVRKLLAKYDVKEDEESDYTIVVDLSAEEKGYVAGIGKNIYKVKVDATISLKEDKLEIISFSKKAKGMGSSYAKAIIKGISVLRLKGGMKDILEKMSGPSTDVPKIKIAVFNFQNTSVNVHWHNWHNTARALNAMVITALINSRKFEVVERSQLEAIMKEQQLSMMGMTDTDAEKIGQLTGAEYLVMGNAANVGGKIEVDARLVKVSSASSIAAASVTGYGVEQLRLLSKAIVKKLTKNLKKAKK